MGTEPSRAIKLFGTEEPVAPLRSLRAGPLSVELDNGNLRYIRVNGVEALRGIAFIVRDKNWGTYRPTLENLKVEETGEGFSVAYDAICKDAAQELRYSAQITGSRDGSLRFEGKAEAITDFITTRSGFVVLHPLAGVSGCPAEVEHVGGGIEHAPFPELIDPYQPFKNMRAISHALMPGVAVTCTLEGDTFEMEDHRNWMDASYKTYVRPLELPWPFTLKAGETSEQAVSLKLRGQLPAAATAAAPIRVALAAVTGAMPRIGLGLEPRHIAAALTAADSIRLAGPQLIVCHYDPRVGHDVGVLRGFKAVGEATGAELVLEAVVPCTEDHGDELKRIAAEAAQAGAEFAAVSVSPAADLKSTPPGSKWPDVPPCEDIYASARAAFPGITLGGGMFSYFTELNRKRPAMACLDFITHTTGANVHACDDLSVTENLEALPYIIKSTQAFSAGKPYRIGPSAIAMRANPYGASTLANPDNRRIAMARMDPRQRGLLGAAWNLGYAAHAARGGIEVLTLSAPVGEFGIVYHAMDYAQPWFDEAGGVYPLYPVIRGLAAAADAPMLATVSSHSREVECVAYQNEDSVTLWLANLTGDQREVEIAGLPRREGSLRVLDEATFVTAVAGPDGFDGTVQGFSGPRLKLSAYAVVRLDVSV